MCLFSYLSDPAKVNCSLTEDKEAFIKNITKALVFSSFFTASLGILIGFLVKACDYICGCTVAHQHAYHQSTLPTSRSSYQI